MIIGTAQESRFRIAGEVLPKKRQMVAEDDDDRVRILATPALLYVVGVANPHVAIGTSALAVSVNAFANLYYLLLEPFLPRLCVAAADVHNATSGAPPPPVGHTDESRRTLFIQLLTLVLTLFLSSSLLEKAWPPPPSQLHPLIPTPHPLQLLPRVINQMSMLRMSPADSQFAYVNTHAYPHAEADAAEDDRTRVVGLRAQLEELTPALQPVFATDFLRTTWLLTPAPGVRIEMALDRGGRHLRQRRLAADDLRRD